MNEIDKFCEIIRKRSVEHSKAMSRIGDLPGIMVSILRQELDSMVRVIYLLAIQDISERKRLVIQTLNGETWTVKTVNNKNRKVTDREMVDFANSLRGWTLSVYKFGCAFIHFSNFHDYSVTNPFDLLNINEKTDILKHLRNYHGGPIIDNPSFDELSAYFPKVFDKISGNLECYVKHLENNEALDNL